MSNLVNPSVTTVQNLTSVVEQAEQSERQLLSSLGWVLAIFIAALLPRLYGLDAFLTIDEVKWAEGAAQFLSGLSSGDLFQTYWHFHPGITITWGSALTLGLLCAPAPDLAVCANARVEHLAETIGWLRLTPVLLTSLGVAAVYGVGQKLLGQRLALLTALLLAFDPFFIAHSRILNGDAGAAIFMFLSLLTFLSYVFTTGSNPGGTPIFHPMLIGSGVFAGLALLTKLPAPLIGVFMGGVGLVSMLQAGRIAGVQVIIPWVARMLLWGSVALLVFVLLWPAMWVAPWQTLRLIYIDAFEVGGVGEGHETFFLGQISADPGLLFYPYVIAFRLTPVTLGGLVLLGGGLLLGFRKNRDQPEPKGSMGQPHSAMISWIMIVFIIFIILFSAVSPKKLDRYVMAVIPALLLLAAVGFLTLRRWTPQLNKFLPALLTGLITLQLLFALLAAPYYLTYYNPLLGGLNRAVDQVPVGWGEGLERAAQYLNQLPNATTLTVSSWYSDIFHPYFVGQRASFSDDGRAQLAADYVVFYVNQIQRQKPYDGLVNYFRASEPVFSVAIKPVGQAINQTPDAPSEPVHWVEVYKAPAAQSAGGAPKVEGVAQLLAYKFIGPPVIDSAADSVVANLAVNEIAVTLYFRVLGPMPEGTTFAVSLNPTDNGLDSLSTWRPLGANGEWQAGNINEWSGLLTLPPSTPARTYRPVITFQFETGEVITQIPISENDPVIRIAKFQGE